MARSNHNPPLLLLPQVCQVLGTKVFDRLTCWFEGDRPQLMIRLHACGLAGDLDALGLHNFPELYVSVGSRTPVWYRVAADKARLG